LRVPPGACGQERPSRIPRSISSLRAGLPGGAVFRLQLLQLRAPNGCGSVLIGLGSALAGAAPATQEPRAIAALTSIFVITWWFMLLMVRRPTGIQ